MTSLQAKLNVWFYWIELVINTDADYQLVGLKILFKGVDLIESFVPIIFTNLKVKCLGQFMQILTVLPFEDFPNEFLVLVSFCWLG
jgi:hypothetical protein